MVSTSQNFRALIPATVALRDCIFLSLVLILSLILYIRGLGFYSDDWAFLSILLHSGADSLSDLFRVMYNDQIVGQRPLQAFQLAWMYWMFAADPLGYHLTNSAVFIVTVLLFYLTLRELRLPRLVVLTVPLVYGLLPHYSTDRFWVAAFQTNMSMALYFASLYADLRAVRTERLRRWSWKLLSLTCLLGSSLAYEVAIPLFLLNAAVVWLYAKGSHTSESSDWRERVSGAVLVGSNLVILLLAICYRAATTTRAGGFKSDYASHILYVIKQTVIVDYVSLGIALPYVTAKVFIYHTDPAMVILGAVLGAAVFAYLYRVAGQAENGIQELRVWLTVLVLSLVVHFLGYAIFFSTSNFMVHKTGIANRITIAAAVGVAMTFAGGAGLVSALMPSAWLRRIVFPSVITLLCLCGFLIINATANFWAAAYTEERLVLADIRANITTLPAGSTLILDGVCPYIGPGIVFESHWDLAGALQIIYNEPKLRADVVTPKMKVGEDRLTTSMYGTTIDYQYGNNLLLYDFRHKVVHKLVDAETTRRFFESRKSDSNYDCPKGREGEGVAPF